MSLVCVNTNMLIMHCEPVCMPVYGFVELVSASSEAAPLIL